MVVGDDDVRSVRINLQSSSQAALGDLDNLQVPLLS